MKAKFELGRCYLTPSARFELEASDYPFECLLIRHQQGDWGLS